MSYISFTYHLVFSTYCRRETIDIAHERELYKYIYDFSTARGVTVRRIGGMPDHVHILCDIPPRMAVAEFVRSLKAETSKFMRANGHFPKWEKWSDGYGGFTIDAASRNTRINYIMHQKKHHSGRSFEDEYRELLLDAGLSPDELR